MMAQHAPHQTKDKRRVKVYELRNNDWFDRGTGFCTAAFTSSEDGQCRDARVIVESEDEPERLLLDTSICKEDGFQKQRDTLIVWTEPSSGLDMALSFQEAEGCAMIWKFVNSVQQSVHNGMSAADDSLSDDLTMEMVTSISLPAVKQGNLAEIETGIRLVSASGAGRDALAKYILKEDYMRKLVPLVEMSEDLESLADLHRLCNIVKTVILLNDPALIEHMVTDDCIDGVIGALEYDPDFPSHKANHRQWLNGDGRFIEVVPFEDDQVRQKIHQTYRLQYLKDVVLARILDDPTFSVLNSLIFFNQVEIVQHVRDNDAFLNELFGIIKSDIADCKRKKDAVLFIQQCCAIAKNLQIPARQTLYNNFILHGLLYVINFGLRHSDVGVRVGATDILVSLIDHDPQMIRQTIYRQLSDGDPPLTDSLIELLLVEVDLGVKSQISDALKVLLDGLHMSQIQENMGRAAGEFVVAGRRVIEHNPQQEDFLARFYETSALRLFKPLLDLEGKNQLAFSTQEASMFSYLIEILSFFIRQHYHRSKAFVLQKNLSQRIAQLLQSEEKYLRLVAIRFFRQLLGLQDVFYIKHLIDKDIFGPILDILISTVSRDNLLGSACLEFFEFIKKESMRDLVKHLVQTYRDKFVVLSELETFGGMIQRYDQTQGFTTGDFLVDSEEDVTRRPTGHSRMMEQLHVDPSEEEYWNASDDEDEQPAFASGKAPVANGASPVARQLVDYLSDGDDEDDIEGGERGPAEVSDTEKLATKDEGDMRPKDGITPEVKPDTEEETSRALSAGGISDTASVTSEAASDAPSVTGPPRLAEKRRREEDDDDDELGKMMQNKRRNSKSMAANAAATQSILKRKNSFTGSNGGASPKIAISISSTGAGLRSNEES